MNVYNTESRMRVFFATLVAIFLFIPLVFATNPAATQPYPDYSNWNPAPGITMTIDDTEKVPLRGYMDGKDTYHSRNIVYVRERTNTSTVTMVLWYEALNMNDIGRVTRVRFRVYQLGPDEKTFHLIHQADYDRK